MYYLYFIKLKQIVMRTKKEIRETYRCQVSMNRITDELINKARYELAMNNVGNPTQKDVVDTAYDLQTS